MDEKEKIIESKLITMEERLQVLEDKIDSLTKKVDNISNIIESGEFRIPVRMNNYTTPWKIKEIIQHLVDRPADLLTKAADTSEKLNKIINFLRVIGWIFMITAAAILIATR